MCFLTRASASGGTGSLFLIHFNPRFRERSDANMYNFLVYICKNHSTTYKLIIILLFHTVKQIKYSYWKKCESICIFMYTCDSHLTLSGIICIHPFHHWLRFDGENLVYYEAIINQYSTPKS